MKTLALQLLDTLADSIDPDYVPPVGKQLVTLRDLMITDESGRLVPLVSLPVQRQLIREFGLDPDDPCPSIADLRLRKRILKARREGVTTILMALFFIDTYNNPNRRTVHVSNDKANTESIFEMVMRFHRNLPEEKKRPAPRQNTSELYLSDIDSSFKCGTAGTKNLFSGATLHNLHKCLSENHFVIGEDGEPLPMLETFGKRIRTGNGRLAEVVDISKQRAADLGWETLKRIAVNGCPAFPIECTPDHLVMVRGKDDFAPIWKRADEITHDDYIAFPLNGFNHRVRTEPLHRQNNSRTDTADHVVMNRDMGYFCGLYLAEGSKSSTTGAKGATGLVIHSHVKEAGRVRDAIDFLAPYITSFTQTNEDGLRLATRISGSTFARWVVSLFGSVDEKRIPDRVWEYSSDFAKGLVHGFFDGDGSYTVLNRVDACSVRPRLIVQMKRLLIALRIGYPSIHVQYAVVNTRNNREQWRILNYGPGNIKIRRMIGLPVPPPPKTKASLIAANPNFTYGRHEWRRGKTHYWARVNSVIDIPAPEFVYDLVLDHPDHSYTTLGGVVHNSERAKWEGTRADIAAIDASLDEACRMGNIIEETTAQGFNFFKNDWDAAIAGEDNYDAIFFAWFMDPRYRSVVPPGFVRTQEEEQRAIAYNLSDEQLQWYREKRKERKELTEQEYPDSPEDAFISSGAHYFNRDVLIAMSRELSGEQYNPLPWAHGITGRRTGTVMIPTEYTALRRVLQDQRESTYFRIWETPQPRQRYIIAADTAQGVTASHDSDYCSAHIMNAQSCEIIGAIHGRFEPHGFAELLAEVGWWYAYHDYLKDEPALIAVERENHGSAVNGFIQHEHGYPTQVGRNCTGLYMHDPSVLTGRAKRYGGAAATVQMGYPSTSAKKYADDTLAKYLTGAEEPGAGIWINDREAVTECLAYVHLPGGAAGGESGKHDDRVRSLAICAAVHAICYDQPLSGTDRRTHVQGYAAPAYGNARGAETRR